MSGAESTGSIKSRGGLQMVVGGYYAAIVLTVRYRRRERKLLSINRLGRSAASGWWPSWAKLLRVPHSFQQIRNTRSSRTNEVRPKR